MVIILIIVGLILILSIYFTNETATKPKNSILINVTLPYNKLKNKEVLDIVSLYRIENRRLMLLALSTLILEIFISYPSLQFIYLLLIVLGLMCGSSKIFNKYNKQLMELKREKDWLLPNKYVITIDTEVSRMKDKMPISKWWFIPSVIISIIPIIIAVSKNEVWGNSMVIASLTSIISTIVFMILYRSYSSQRNEVYSEDSKVNLACNTISKRYWTFGWVAAATIQSISMSLMFWFMMMATINGILVSMVVVIPTTIVILGIFYINNKIRKEQNKLIETISTPIYTDWDEYWKNDTYNNPHDSRIMVEKRIGYGMQFNMGNKKGRMIAYLSYVFIIILLGGLTVQMLIFDFSEFSLSVSGDVVKISVPEYGTTFNIEDVQEIELVNDIPSRFRTDAIGTDRYSLGYYSVNGYGKSLLYVYSKNPPYIKIKLKDKYIFINGENKEETERYYKELQAMI